MDPCHRPHLTFPARPIWYLQQAGGDCRKWTEGCQNRQKMGLCKVSSDVAGSSKVPLSTLSAWFSEAATLCSSFFWIRDQNHTTTLIIGRTKLDTQFSSYMAEWCWTEEASPHFQIAVAWVCKLFEQRCQFEIWKCITGQSCCLYAWPKNTQVKIMQKKWLLQKSILLWYS